MTTDEFTKWKMYQRATEIVDESLGIEHPREMRTDGYVNMLTKFGTQSDSSMAYGFAPEAPTDPLSLTIQYTDNGLFAKIIDTPAEEAIKHGFDLNIDDEETKKYITRRLNDVEWEDNLETAIRWARLYGGSVAVMLIDDGGGLEDPLDYKRIKTFKEMYVFEKSVVTADISSAYSYSQYTRLGEPEFYMVSSQWGSFRVHESRCLIFKNGKMPENAMDEDTRLWGLPEYTRIKKQMQECMTSHGYSVKMLERCIQAVYSMKDLASTLETDDGEDFIMKRLQVIDLARSLMNSIAIDKDGETYDFKSAQFSGIKDILDGTCTMLSAVTSIPQTILFGRSPAGENATGESDFENYYNFVERIQKKMLRKNIARMVDIVIAMGINTGKLREAPDYDLKFNPLWSMSDTEQATVEQAKAAAALTRAQTAQIYVDMTAIDPSEVREKLTESGEFNVESILDGKDPGELDISMLNGEAGATAAPGSAVAQGNPNLSVSNSDEVSAEAAAVIVLDKSGNVLCAIRSDNYQICGPGGHIEDGETPVLAAIRETGEEFGITPNALEHLGFINNPAPYYPTEIYLCRDFSGNPEADGKEMINAGFLPINKLMNVPDRLFPPFKESLNMLIKNDEWEESKHPREEDGKFGEGGSSGGGTSASSQTQSSNNEKKDLTSTSEGSNIKSSPNVSAKGVNPNLKGFSQINLNKHWGSGEDSDHSDQYTGMAKEQYAKRAHDLVRQETSDTVLGYKTDEGKVVRYDSVNNDFASGYDNGVATMFKPEKGEEYFQTRLWVEGIEDDE